jgi:hypothetical protein
MRTCNAIKTSERQNRKEACVQPTLIIAALQNVCKRRVCGHSGALALCFGVSRGGGLLPAHEEEAVFVLLEAPESRAPLPPVPHSVAKVWGGVEPAR